MANQNDENNDTDISVQELKNLPHSNSSNDNLILSNSTVPTSSTDHDSPSILETTESTTVTLKSTKTNTVPKSDILETKLTFLLFGMSGVLYWTITLNLILSVFTTVYNFPRGADTILIGYFLLSFIVSWLRYVYRTLNSNLVKYSLYLLYFSSMAFALTIYLFDDLVGIILLHLVASLIGLAVSVLVSNGMAYAAIIPLNMTGFVMAGQGLAGVFGFLLWQFLTQLFFDIYDKGEIRIAIWIAFVTCNLPTIINHILFIRLLSKPFFKTSLIAFYTTSRIPLDPVYAESFKSHDHKSLTYKQNNLIGARPPKYIFKDILKSMLLGICTVTLTFSLFPNISPNDFLGRTIVDKTLMVGTFQTIDFLGRLIPNLSRSFLIPYKYFIYLVPARIIFYPLIILPAVMPNVVFSHFAYQFVIIFLLAATNGFISSQTISDIPRRVLTTAERGISGLILNISMQLGLFTAIMLSQIIKTIYNFF